jgi:uncharacterized membrane protein
MEIRLPSNGRNAVAAIALLSLLIGVWARVQHLERKVFWPDEVFTALRVSGHSLAGFRRLFDDELHTLAAVEAFQVREPGNTVAGLVTTLAAEEPQHPPLFYVLDRFAIDLFGSSVAAYRSVSVLAGLLSIVCAFALGRVAFGSPAGGFVLASLVAVSPFHVHLSRQAREYELFSTFALGSSALLLWALAGPHRLRWSAYALCAALGLYTDPLFAGVIAAHGITVVATRRTRAALGSFLAACAAALLAFAPWAAVLLAERASAHAQLDWLAGTYPLKFFAQKWLFNFGTVAFDAELRDLRLTVVVAAFALLVAFAAVRAVRVAVAVPAEPAAVLGLSLSAIPLLVFGAYDIVEKAHYTTVARYFAGTAVGVEILVASWLVRRIGAGGRGRALGLTLFALVALAGIGSDLASAGAVNWWDNNNQINYRSVAAVLNAEPAPVVAVGDAAAALVLTHYLRADARFVLVADPARSAARLAELPGPEFLIAPSDALKTAIGAGGASLVDVSPASGSPMAEFRAGLERERPDARAAVGPGSAGNAVWAVRPAPHASPSEASSADGSN